MRTPEPPELDVTTLLVRAGEGDADAVDRVFGRVYGELRILAERQRRRWTGDFTLNATALVHEAYLKLVGRGTLDVRERGHFFALASRAMRQILCNHARDRRAGKRGGDRAPVSLGALADATSGSDDDQLVALIDLDRALTRLEGVHPRAAQVVECRFFGGMSVDETASALGVSDRTVKRDWEFAQSWLHSALRSAP